ncbi:MAG: ubiquitin family protein [Candidatus Nanoarchaeia archaeon]|nr:ubiquitin family protein [Candidatus Nanoarchaeia archaeon]
MKRIKEYQSDLTGAPENKKITLLYKSSVGLGQNGTCEASESDTIKEVKERIAAIEAVDATGIALMFGDKILDDGCRLKEYGIRDQDKIEVVPKHRRGG